MKNLLLLLLALFSLNTLWAQSLIAVEHNGQSTFYTTIQEAVQNAPSGATVYLPGGIYSSLEISKQLNIVGVGYHPDSTSATTSTVINNLNINAGASGGSISGLFVFNTVYVGNSPYGLEEISDFEISRCFLNSGIILKNSCGTQNWSPSTRFIIRENIIGISTHWCSQGFSIYGWGGEEFNQVSNNIILGIVWADYSEIANNVFLYNQPAQIIGVHNSTVRNNIFIYSICYGGQTSAFYNNLNCGVNGIEPGNNNVGSNNYLNTPPTFVNYSGSGFSFIDDFHLTTNYLGTDGTYVGIYGGPYPWKEGGVPYNPHIRNKAISSTTNAQGSLNVQIRVAAQEH